MCVYIHMCLLCHQAQVLLERGKPAMAPQCQPTEIQMHFVPREHNPHKESSTQTVGIEAPPKLHFV